MSRERPIIFSAPMVRAILADQKTQTRRAIRTPLRDPDFGCELAPCELGKKEIARLCPYGQPGDRLWVRETWRTFEEVHYHTFDDGEIGDLRQTYVAYAATPRVGLRTAPDRTRVRYLDDSSPVESDRRLLGPWRSPILMPRRASRLTLEVEQVRVQRLQEINEEDAQAEGVDRVQRTARGPCQEDVSVLSARDAFAAGWDHINGKRAPWAGNPWVWVITFRRLP